MSILKNLIVGSVFSLSGLGCVSFVKPPAVEVVDSEQALKAYKQVLTRFVNDQGAVDYSQLQKDRVALDQYVAYVSQKPLDNFPDANARLAHYLNSYNALSMYLVLEKGVPTTNAGIRKVFFFYLTDLKIGGQKMSLHSYENNIIRKIGDERVHFALNCMSVSCPRLPKVPFSSENLEAELQRETRFFFSEERNLSLDKQAKKVRVSKILEFFTEDFVPKKAASLIEYIGKWTDKQIPSDYELDFVDYDWTIFNSSASAKTTGSQY